ncbi:hypothetical protein CONCODRAFT_80633 [Conidiobolus coronatus NRRL 28638]|uniref:Uncharacterized protein n=1 Tax=Conidiobolus coronatus (strain ATCC 28846 / CBS 209.66 / NRRL 28638) TaxID=796925 RepID=A0A137NT59_CONC2|nr:hypothetical protein CONCODRAFT_80633 [Conidiobolus coronatus NRRL 28638]|eukprot:KXN65975.1 hypothetical protein CONCODRAFT_80633 [Conidiobolus coronatus NRRL 28638]
MKSIIKFRTNSLLPSIRSINSTYCRFHQTSTTTTSSEQELKPTKNVQTSKTKKQKPSPIVFSNRSKGPSLNDFLLSQATPSNAQAIHPPYLNLDIQTPKNYFVEVYGCQMNVNDTEILMSVMNSAGYKRTHNIEEAHVVFLVTCSIRENAESRIWHRLYDLKKMKIKDAFQTGKPPVVGIKGKLLEKDKLVDLVCGPDAYRSIPHLLHLSYNSEQNQGVANVILSADETYADIVPMRINPDAQSVFLSIMRGCNNMCSYCIVPFTRGIERSRPIESILDEVRRLSDQGIKEITLLGQNVNSYRDTSSESIYMTQGEKLAEGFNTIYKAKTGGIKFTELMDRVSLINPDIRIRFTSPHPKDFPDDLIHLIKERPNLCNTIHMPAQSGNTEVLDRMRRGYSREAYIALVDKIKSIIPNVSLSSDFIVGFCGETEAEHQDTVSLMEYVGYDMAYMFAYSMREKTHAHRKFQDDVSDGDKKRRLQDIIKVFHTRGFETLGKMVGTYQLLLIENIITHPNQLEKGRVFSGRTDGNHKAFVMMDPILKQQSPHLYNIKAGDYVVVKINKASSTSVSGTPVEFCSVSEFAKKY